MSFDSSLEFTQFILDEQVITGNSLGTGVVFQYPGYTGLKISASLVSPYQNGAIDGWAVLSCRVSYLNGIPRVTVFVDNVKAGLPVCDGLLLVFATGASQ
ncbi:hypothetical protein ACO0K0_02385 [Undibacterium sp. SXout11W]|uniref:hypothetical protein n=1 Tax=Undibacterium sp. SXout11W TaxID=3413050 RepID=UPI003BF0CE78